MFFHEYIVSSQGKGTSQPVRTNLGQVDERERVLFEWLLKRKITRRWMEGIRLRKPLQYTNLWNYYSHKSLDEL